EIAVKSVIYHPGIKQSPDLYGLAEKATDRLNEIVGMYGKEAEVEWDTSVDESKRKPLVTLTIRDLPEEVRGNIAREDLEKPDMLTLRLARLWGDLLQTRSHRLLRNLMENGDEENN